MVSHKGVSIYYHPSDGNDWAHFLKDKFMSKEYGLDCILNDFSIRRSFHVISTAVNVFLVTPDFLDCQNWDVLRSVDNDTCIAILTGVDMVDFEAAAKTYDSEYVCHDWRVRELSNTEEAVREMLVDIIRLYEDVEPPAPCPEPCHRTRSRVASGIYENAHWDNETDEDEDLEEDDEYDTLPAPRQVNGLVETFCKDDQLYLVLLRRADNDVEVNTAGHTFSTVPQEYAVYRVPQCSAASTTSVTVVQNDNVIGTSDIIRKSTRTRQTTNAETQTEVTDENMNNANNKCNRLSHNVNNNIYANFDSKDLRKNVQSHRHSESEVEEDGVKSSNLDKIRELLENEIDPEQMLCRCLGIKKEPRRLDEALTAIVKNCVTPLKNLTPPSRRVSSEVPEVSTWPTLLHFGARFNLTEFCDTLLQCPLLQDLSVRKNKHGQLPHDIARENGHAALASKLEAVAKASQTERENKYDSGFSGISGISMDTSRLSCVTLVEEPPPPTPHKMPSHSGYINMSGSPPKTQISVEDPFTNILGFQEMSGQGAEPVNIPARRPSLVSNRSEASVSSIEDGTIEFKHKDIGSMLGMTSTSEPSSKKGKSGFMGFLKRNRSKSVPVDPNAKPELVQKRRLETKVYKKDSPRSSGSSSTASIHSESSIKEEDSESQVKMRGKKKETKKFLSFSHSDKRRHSVRMKHAMEEKILATPNIPERRQGGQSEHLQQHF